MATLLLQAAGSALGAGIGGQFGAVLGQAAGSLAGAAIDRALFGSGAGAVREGPRLTALAGLTSTEGAAIPRIYGRVRVGGQVIWATRFEEQVETVRSGGSGGKGGLSGSPAVESTTYSYFANLAIGLCEGPVGFVRRVWADGKEIDVTRFTMRLHRGDEQQEADPLIVAKEGAGQAPAYRGLAYVVFERLPLADFGDRVPQLSFEVVKPVAGLAQMIRGVDLIPGATEFGYSVGALTTRSAPGVSASENRSQLFGPSDWIASLDALQALCPNLVSVALVVSWFGDDLRCGQCTIAPRVEKPVKDVVDTTWSVAGLTRANARVVSQVDGGPAIGGTPCDDTIIGAIRDLKARGLSVVFYPFVMMDVPAGNTLVDPWTGGSSQTAFPWRGRIACDPAPGRAGSPDATAEAGTQVVHFFGAATPSAQDWTYRRFILHCADLCRRAGGVDAFLVGSELVALTRVRSSSGVYPAADALVALAGDVKGVLGANVKVSYGADWTEYGAHVLDGANEVRFPLDVVWASPNVDFVGIDAYFPLSDWRDGLDHADAAVATSVHDLAYLRMRVASGEGFDWYYANDAERVAQLRRPITDGAYGKPWIYRPKDLRGWWSNAHVERVGGRELARTTGWIPQSKPIWLTEIGCPAVDRGANAPNVFVDDKSSESALPPFSRGFRDDLMQARALEAIIGYYDPLIAGGVGNPVSNVYGGRMVDVSRIHVWAWDARPFPAFPSLSGLWRDAANWEKGHWLNGRLEGAPVDRLVGEVARDASLPGQMKLGEVDGFVDGFALDRVMSTRAALEPLCALFGFDALMSGGVFSLKRRAERHFVHLGEDDLVPDKDGRLLQLTRAQESELPGELALAFTDGARDYRAASVLSRRLEGWSRRQSQAEAAVVMDRAQARRQADCWLQDLWVARETLVCRVRPTLVSLEAGDAVSVDVDGARRLYRILSVTDGAERLIHARAFDPLVYDAPPAYTPAVAASRPQLAGPPYPVVLDLAYAIADGNVLQYLGVFADPWPGAMALWRGSGGSFSFERNIARCAIIGDTLDLLAPGPVARVDRGASLRVKVRGGALASVSEGQMLGGANAAALRGADGAWEIFSFAGAELVGEGVYRLSLLLRGLGGEAHLAQRTLPAGSLFVLLDSAITPLVSGMSRVGAQNAWRVGPADRDYADAACASFGSLPTAKALTPYAPARVRASRGAQGVTFAILRRGRREADGWDLVEIPLGEESEAYQLDILRNGAVVRSLSATGPDVVYPTALELADFGSAQGAFDVQAFQMSAAVGRGFALSARIVI